MTDKQLQKARDLIKKNPHLVWYTKNYNDLSPDSIVEAVLNYGNWDDFIKTQKIFGLKTLSLLFKKISEKKRTNIKPQTKNYFDKYFFKYA